MNFSVESYNFHNILLNKIIEKVKRGFFGNIHLLLEKNNQQIGEIYITKDKKTLISYKNKQSTGALIDFLIVESLRPSHKILCVPEYLKNVSSKNVCSFQETLRYTKNILPRISRDLHYMPKLSYTVQSNANVSYSILCEEEREILKFVQNPKNIAQIISNLEAGHYVILYHLLQLRRKGFLRVVSH